MIGSGFGGSVCALRLAEKGYSVAVVEQGRRYADKDFAKSAWRLRKYLWAPALGLRGIMRRTVLKHATILTGVGVGGGSLVYGNTLYVPQSDRFFKHPQWRQLADWRAELAPHYETALRMLGVSDYEGAAEGERAMAEIASEMGVEDTLRPTPVAIFQGEPGQTVPDPYFGGDGPDRTGCIRCGQCMLGCRHGAKNTLVKNYLWLAERLGVRVLDGRRVIDLQPVGGTAGANGYSVVTRRPGAWLRRRRSTIRAQAVVFAGGAMGTNELLLRCKRNGSLPSLSNRVGKMVRTNSEAITAATSRDRKADYGRGAAITRSVFPGERTHINNNTFGTGGSALALTYGPLTSGDRRLPRPLQVGLALLRHPLRWSRHFLAPRRWSQRTIIFSIMQDEEVCIDVRLGRSGRLQSERSKQEPPPHAWLPVANEIAAVAAEQIGGYAQSSLAESLRGSPTTGHFMGGAIVGASPLSGVIDRYRRVFGYSNLLVCDGASIPANVGVNPSLTITAMAEEAMSHVAPKRGA